MFPLSLGPPTMAVLPSEDSATEMPCAAAPFAPEPTSFGPCCENWASAIWDEKSRPAKNSTESPNILNDPAYVRRSTCEGTSGLTDLRTDLTYQCTNCTMTV